MSMRPEIRYFAKTAGKPPTVGTTLNEKPQTKPVNVSATSGITKRGRMAGSKRFLTPQECHDISIKAREKGYEVITIQRDYLMRPEKVIAKHGRKMVELGRAWLRRQ